MKRVCFIYWCLIIFTIGALSSCRNLLNSDAAEVSLFLPFGAEDEASFSREASASSISYSYVVTLTHEDGTATELTGNSGDTLTLKPAAPGDYTISGNAFDSTGRLRYQGSTTATVYEGKTTDVTLPLTAVSLSSESKHVKLEQWEKGIKLTLFWREGDGDWEWGNTFVYHQESGTAIRLTELPKKDKPVVYYCSLTNPGYVLSIQAELSVGNAHYSESVAIIPSAGDSSFISYDEAYFSSKVTADSTGTVKISRDITSAFDSSKIKELNPRYYFDVYGLNDDVAAPSDKAEWLDSVTINYADKDSFVKNGIYLWDDYVSAVAKACEYKYWYVYLCIEFTDPNAPDTILRTPFINSARSTIQKPEEYKSSKHISVASDTNGIKITLKNVSGDQTWQDWWNVREVSSGLGFDFCEEVNRNNHPSSSAQTKEYIYPFTESGKIYTFKFSSTITGEYKEEYVWCKAGGGLGNLIDMDKWQALKPEVNNVDFTYKLGDVSTIVTTANLAKFDEFRVDLDLSAGEDGGPNEWICGQDYHFKGAYCNTTADVNYTNLGNAHSINCLDRYAKYRLGNLTQYDSYYVDAKIHVKLAGDTFDYSCDPIRSQTDWFGERIKWVQGKEKFTGNLYKVYCCDENLVSKLNAQEVSIGGAYGILLTLDSDFDNDEFELELHYDYSNALASFNSNDTYNLSFTIARYDSSVTPLTLLSATQLTETYKFKAEVGAEGESFVYTYGGNSTSVTPPDFSFEVNNIIPYSEEGTPFIRFCPYKAGQYYITNISLE